MNMSKFINHYKRICKPVVTQEVVMSAQIIMVKSPETVLENPNSYHLEDIGLFINELSTSNPVVLNEDVLCLYIIYRLMLQEGVLLHYDKSPVYTLSDVLRLSVKVSGNFVECLSQGETVVSIPTVVNLDKVTFDAFYKHYARYYKETRTDFYTRIVQALRKVRYECDKVIKDNVDLSTMRLFDIITKLNNREYRVVDQQALSLYLLWRMYDEYHILMDRCGSGTNCECMILDNITCINDDMIRFKTVSNAAIMRNVPVDMMPAENSGSPTSNAEQMHTLNDIAHYCAEKNIGVLSFISAMFADKDMPADTYLDKIKQGWAAYKEVK